MDQKIIFIADAMEQGVLKELSTTVSGTSLALNPVQSNNLKNNFQSKVIDFQATIKQTAENISVSAMEDNFNEPIVPSELGPEIVDPPVMEPVIDPSIVSLEEPVKEVMAPAVEPIIPPSEPVIPMPEVVPITPIQEEMTEMNESGKVEIVAAQPQENNYDSLITEIIHINHKYDEQIIALNKQREEEITSILENSKKKITDEEAKTKDFQQRAEEHLKNAQAAEQIANIAQTNAQMIQNELDPENPVKKLTVA